MDYDPKRDGFIGDRFPNERKVITDRSGARSITDPGPMTEETWLAGHGYEAMPSSTNYTAFYRHTKTGTVVPANLARSIAEANACQAMGVGDEERHADNRRVLAGLAMRAISRHAHPVAPPR